MLKVLQIVDNMNAGGIQSFIMNVYRLIDREKINFDFLLCKEHPIFEDEIRRLGGCIYYIPARSKGIVGNRKALNTFFNEHNSYDVVHMHESSLSYIEPLIFAKKAGIQKRIIHSHNTKVPGSTIHRLLHFGNQFRIGNIATDYIACGEAAANWMYQFSNVRCQAKIIYNGIDIKKFAFNDAIRNEIRNELGLTDEMVIGHAGRFEPVKNHLFLLDIFSELLKMRRNSVLLLAGTGRMVESVMDKAKLLGIDKSVLFLGVRNDLHRLYQGMDCLVLPSLYEGFPVTIIEAEASGLPCVMANTVTNEACLKQNVVIEDLEKSASQWAETILKVGHRIVDNSVLYEKGFDIKSTVDQLTQLYNS